MFKIISGGQTGVDRTGLEVAKEFGIPTGGVAPLGFRTELGSDPTLGSKFDLTEDTSSSYTPRTWLNVLNSSATAIFGDLNSPGSRQTVNYCNQLSRPWIANPTPAELVDFINSLKIPWILNIAGNRLSKSPTAAARARITLTKTFETLGFTRKV